MEFGERVKDFRKDAGLTQGEVAGKLGISQPYYSDLERDKRSASVDELLGLCVILDTTPDILLGYPHSMPKGKASSASKFISIWDRLNEEGTRRLLEYATDLDSIDKYRL